MKKELIDYFKSLGIEVYTNTKARGHQGFFLKNRIDVSKNIKGERVIPTLLHEFTHFIHTKLEPDMIKTGGTIEKIFDLPRLSQSELEIYKKELVCVTNFVDENSTMQKLKQHKEKLKQKIKVQEAEIKKDYPKFMRSKKFKEFDKYIKKTNAKYLLKYDRVKFVSPHIFKLFKKEEFYSIDTIEQCFPDMPKAFCAYLRLKSIQRKQARNSARINRLKKYYEKPTELFSRLVEGFYLDKNMTIKLAPKVSERFLILLECGYYRELKTVFQMVYGRNIETTELSPKYLLAQS